MTNSSASHKLLIVFVVTLFTASCIIYDYTKPKDSEHDRIMQIFNANSYLNILEGKSFLEKGKNPYEFDFLYKSPVFFYTMTFLNLSHYQL